MKKKRPLIDYEIKFWKDWLDADFLKRHDMVAKLPFYGMALQLNDLSKKDEKLAKHAFTTMLNGYFEDLESAVYTKMWLDGEKKKVKR